MIHKLAVIIVTLAISVALSSTMPLLKKEEETKRDNCKCIYL